MIINLHEDDNPVITTERLTLRLLEDNDAADILEIRGDQDTADDAGVPCMKSIEEAQAYIRQWYEDSMAIVLGNEVIGLIESYKGDNLKYNSTFLGYYMKKRHRNQGYMTEALVALTDRMIEDGKKSPMLWIFSDNMASKRVAEKCGWELVDCRLVDNGGRNRFVEFFDNNPD